MLTSFSVKFEFDRKKNVLATHSSKNILPEIYQAIKGGECLKIIYWGGSQPGEVRELVPLSVFEDEKKILARCEVTKLKKYYILEKMEIVSVDSKESYIHNEDAEPFDTLLNKYSHLFFQFTSFKIEVQNGELQVYEPYKNNSSRFKTYPFMAIDYASSQKMKCRFSINGWHRSFSGIEEAISFAAYYLHLAQESLESALQEKAS